MNAPSVSPVSIVSGGAGFIGASLVPQLLDAGHAVLVADNFSRGRRSYLNTFGGHPRLRIVEAELSDRRQCTAAFDTARSLGTVKEVWHLAANSDIPAGVADADIDLKDTFLSTFELLRAMKAANVREFYFASSSAIYGDLGDAALHEAIGPLLPISNYGAMKLASEAQACAAAESHLDRLCLFRFPNVVGTPATHGVILDFVRKLKADPTTLQVLGNGSQRKAYLHVSDLVAAMWFARERRDTGKIAPLNIGPVDEGVEVRWIAAQVAARVSPGATIAFGTGNRGWVGDVPRFRYSTDRLQALGWHPTMSSQAAVLRAIDEIATQEGL